MTDHAKKCSKCHEFRSFDLFGNDTRRKDGKQSQCKPCKSRYTAEYYAKNSEKVKAYHKEWSAKNQDRLKEYRKLKAADYRDRALRKTYGITSVEYEAMLIAQQHRCSICGYSPSPGERRLAVDHDHSCCPGDTSCGKCVRSLLCSKCNTGIGQFNDDPELLQKAALHLLAKDKTKDGCMA